MQYTTATRKWSDLKGIAAVAINTGQKAGTVEDFYFDTKSSNILALLIKTGLFGHRMLLSNTINAIGTDAVTFVDEAHLLKDKENEEIAALPPGSAILAYRVMSEGGTLVGTIGNIVIDISTPTALKVVAFELSAGMRARISGHYPVFNATQVVRYGRDVIVIPDVVAEALQQ